MRRQVLYRYLGTNGIIESPVHLEDTYFVRIIRLTADEGKVLTDGYEKRTRVTVSEDEESNWREISED